MKTANNLSYERIINEIFVDESGKRRATSLIQKHGFDKILEPLLNHLGKTAEPTDITGIASSFLTRVNLNLANVSDEKEKEYLKYILSEISQYILGFIAKQSKASSEEIFQQVITSTKAVIDINGWDYDDFKKHMPLTALQSYSKRYSEVTAKPLYYDWNGLDHHLDELAKNLKTEGVKSVKEFKKLFRKPTEQYTVAVDKATKDFIFVLFDHLKESELITPRGNKGHFKCLKMYLVDLDGFSLIKEEPKALKYTIKKNTAKWLQLQGKAEKWTGHYKLKKS